MSEENPKTFLFLTLSAFSDDKQGSLLEALYLKLPGQRSIGEK